MWCLKINHKYVYIFISNFNIIPTKNWHYVYKNNSVNITELLSKTKQNIKRWFLEINSELFFIFYLICSSFSIKKCEFYIKVAENWIFIQINTILNCIIYHLKLNRHENVVLKFCIYLYVYPKILILFY